jgi:tetratricopeptide (TPR) repeat protein
VAGIPKRTEDGRAHLERALALAQRSGDTQCRIACLRSLGHDILLKDGDVAAARVYLDEALELTRSLGNRLGEIQVLLSLGFAVYEDAFVRGGGGFAQARSYLEQARRGAREIGYRLGEGEALFYLGHVARDDRSEYALARESYQQALRLAREIGARSREGRALLALADMFCYNLGDYPQARTYYEQAREVSEQIGLQDAVGNSLAGLGVAALALGAYTQAVEHLESASQTGDSWVEAQALDALCRVYHDLGDDQAAVEHGQRALRVAREIDDRLRQGLVLTHLGRALAGLGRMDEAAASFREAAAVHREMAHPHLSVEALAGLAEVVLTQGDGEQARALVDKVLAYLQDSSQAGPGDPTWLYLSCYRVLHAGGDPRAAELLAAAQRLLLEKATTIADEDLRRSFLENVPAHREVVRLCGLPAAG